MALLRVACCLAVLLSAGACGGNSSTPSNPSPSPPGSGGTISGREPLGWSQAADTLAGYSFSIYVDGGKRDAPDAACSSVASGTFDCRASLPSMSNGVHTLEISATVTGTGGSVEGPRSAPLTVTVNATTTTLASLQMHAAGETGGLDSESASRKQPADRNDGLRCGLAPWDEHRALVWMSNGELSLTAADGLRVPLTWRQADDDPWVLSSAARDTDFDSTHFVFLTLRRGDAGQDRLRVARYREVQGTLGERAILLDQRLDFSPAGTWAGMDADGRLVVALLGPSTDTTRPHEFITTISTPGAAGIAKANALEMNAPIAVAFAPSGGLAILDAAGSSRFILQASGATRALDVVSPIALRDSIVDGRHRLAVVGADGAILAVMDGADILSLPSLRTSRPLQDVVLVRDGTTVGCETAAGALNVVYGRWLPRNDRSERH